MNIKFLSFSFVRGGAAKAAARFYSIGSMFCKAEKFSVEESLEKNLQRLHFLKRIISFLFIYLFQRKSGVKCSANFFSYRPVLKSLSATGQGLINIHWINNDTLSIFDFKKIPCASIITMHDEWLYCGIEHYFKVDSDFSNSCYHKENDSGLRRHVSPLHFFVWDRKVKAFKNRTDLVVTCPSKWLANRARNSHVFKDCDVRVLHNPVDTFVFSPFNCSYVKDSRSTLGLGERFLVVFGAVGGVKNPLKGFAELVGALEILSRNENIRNRIMLGVFGGKKMGICTFHGFPVHEFGFIETEQEMAKVYSLSHMTIVPSKVEAFGQVAAESQACATPVIGFDTSGLQDVVIDGKTGFLAKPFCSVSLAKKIELLIALQDEDYQKMCFDARAYVIEHFSNFVIAAQYESIVNEQFLKKQEAFN